MRRMHAGSPMRFGDPQRGQKASQCVLENERVCPIATAMADMVASTAHVVKRGKL